MEKTVLQNTQCPSCPHPLTSLKMPLVIIWDLRHRLCRASSTRHPKHSSTVCMAHLGPQCFPKAMENKVGGGLAGKSSFVLPCPGAPATRPLSLNCHLPQMCWEQLIVLSITSPNGRNASTVVYCSLASHPTQCDTELTPLEGRVGIYYSSP